MATTQKTLPRDVPVSEFLAQVTPAKRQADGEVLARLFEEVTGEPGVVWGPSIIGYGQYNYQSPRNPRTRGIWPKTGFSPRKAQLSLYGLKNGAQSETLLPKLGKYTEGAGCVYVRKLEDIDLDILRKLVRIAYDSAVDAN